MLLVTRPEIQVNTRTCFSTNLDKLFYKNTCSASVSPPSPLHYTFLQAVLNFSQTCEVQRHRWARCDFLFFFFQLEDEEVWLDEDQEELVEELKMEILEERRNTVEKHRSWKDEVREEGEKKHKCSYLFAAI